MANGGKNGNLNNGENKNGQIIMNTLYFMNNELGSDFFKVVQVKLSDQN